MKVTVNYKGKELNVDIPDEKLEELIKEKKQAGYERVESNTVYYYVNHVGMLECMTEQNSKIDDKRYDSANYYSSFHFAENIARAETLMRKIRRRSAEICEPVDLKKINIPKWYIYFDYSSSEISTSYAHSVRGLFNIIFDTKKHAEQIIGEFKDELIWYFTEYKERMDV